MTVAQSRAYHMAKARNVARYGGRKDPIQRTPQALFDQLDAEFHFTLDAAASDNNAKCARYFTADDDGRVESWAGETVWCNPPFGKPLKQWVEKAYREAGGGATVVMLLPVGSDMDWWHTWVMVADEVRFIRGRVAFLTESGARQGNSFMPCCIVVFRPPPTLEVGA